MSECAVMWRIADHSGTAYVHKSNAHQKQKRTKPSPPSALAAPEGAEEGPRKVTGHVRPTPLLFSMKAPNDREKAALAFPTSSAAFS